MPRSPVFMGILTLAIISVNTLGAPGNKRGATQARKEEKEKKKCDLQFLPFQIQHFEQSTR